MIDDVTIEVINTQVVKQELVTTFGEARFATDDGSAKLNVSVSGPNGEGKKYILW